MAKIKPEEFSKKVMKGLKIALKKLKDESIRSNQPLIVSIENRIQKVYPRKAS